MSAQFDSTPGLHLPQPSLGEAQTPARPMVQMPPQTLQPSFVTPQTPQQPIQGYQAQAFGQPISQSHVANESQPMVSPVAQALPMEQLQQQPELQTAAQPTAQPVVTDNEKDGDALDEEWITKTKALIEQYKNDPHALSNALSALKADYLKMRHGVIVKVDSKA
jgi:hypothetical protein